MMNIELISGEYKSIKSLKWHDIPDFAVVTGKNGSGKTQLLELLNYHFEKETHAGNSNPGNPFYNVQMKSEGCYIPVDEVLFFSSKWELRNVHQADSTKYTNIINTLYTQIIGRSNNSQYQDLARIVKEKIDKTTDQITLPLVEANLPIDYYDYINRIQKWPQEFEHAVKWKLCYQ